MAAPDYTAAELRGTLDAIDKDPRLSAQPEAVKEGWRALVQGALRAQPGGEAAQGRAHEAAAVALAFTPDGRTLISGTVQESPASIKLWSVADGKLSRTLAGACPEGVWALRASPDGGGTTLESCV